MPWRAWADTTSSGPAAQRTAAGEGPLARMRSFDAALRRTLRRRQPRWSPEFALQSHDIHALTSALLNFGEFSRRTLADHWDALPPAQRKRFVILLTSLIDEVYANSLSGESGYRASYEREEIEDGFARVYGTFNRGDAAYAVEYRLELQDQSWLIYDVVTDGESLVDSYRAQFDSIIRKQSFDALLQRMADRLAAARAKP